jgi:hypothetical protein
MADKFDPNAAFGDPTKTVGGTPSSSAPAAQPGKFNPNEAFGDPTKPPQQQTSVAPSKEEEAYMEKVRRAGPAAEKFVKEQGTSGAFSSGIRESIPILSPLVQSAARATAAALGAGGEGSYSARYENLKAMDEAVRRETMKQHPIAQVAGNIGGSLVLPVGGVANKFTTAAEAAKLGTAGKTAAEIAGVGTEAGLYGGATAAGERAFGTAPESEKPSITGSALEGAGFGVGLGALGKGVSAGFNRYAPEWLQGLGRKDSYQMNKFAENWQKDIENGTAKMTLDEYKQAMEKGQPVTLLDVGGTQTKEWLRKSFRNNQNALEEFGIKAEERLANEGQRLEEFLAKHAGFGETINQDQIRQAAKGYAEKINEQNYGRAAHLPENGRGTWKDSWMTHFDDPDVAGAFAEADKTMKRKWKDAYTSPLSTMADQGVEKLAESGLNNKSIQHLKNLGVETIGDLSKLKADELTELLQILPKTESPQAAAAAKRQTQKLFDDVNGALKKVNPEEFVIDPQKVNVEFLDRWQRQLELNAKKLEATKPELYMDFVKRLRDLKGDILGTLKTPGGKFYNEAFDVAHTQAAQFHRENDAFTAGQQMLNRLSSNEKTSEIANATMHYTPQEKDFFVKGILGQMTQTGLRGGNINYQQLKNWLNRPDVSRALNNTLGQQKYNDLRAFLKAEVAMGDAAKEAARYGSSDRDWRGWVPTALAFYIEQKAGISMLVYRAAEYFMGRRFATSLADKMLSSDSAKVEEALDAINRNPKVKSFFNSLMARALISGNMEDSHRAGFGPQQRADGGRIHKGEGGSMPFGRQLDERGMYSEGAEMARKILPPGQGSGGDLVQRLLNKGVRADELHHSRHEGIPLRDMYTGELHPKLRGKIDSRELADLIHESAPRMSRINRSEGSEDYKLLYNMKSQKSPFSKDYLEMNLTKQPEARQKVFVPPPEELSLIPENFPGFSPYPREEAAIEQNNVFMPIQDTHSQYLTSWRTRPSTGVQVHDKFGNYIGHSSREFVTNLDYLKERPKFQQKAHEDIKQRFAQNRAPRMEHFGDVQNMPYHSRATVIPLQKNGNEVKNLNIEEAQSDAARRYDREKRENGGNYNPTQRYDAGEHKKLYEEASAAQDRLRNAKHLWHSPEGKDDAKKIQDYEDYLDRIRRPGQTPDVPYIESNKTWQRALAKDMLHHAAQNGFESVTVTPWQEIVRRAEHSEPVDAVHVKTSGIRYAGQNAPEQFEVDGLPIKLTMDDLKKVYGDEIENRIRKSIPHGQKGEVLLKDDAYAKKPFYAFIPRHEDVDPEDEDNVQQFIAEIIDSGKSTRRKAEVHNSFIKQLQNVINEEHDPHFKIDYEHGSKHEHPAFPSVGSGNNQVVRPGAFLSPELRESILKKGFKRFKKGGYVANNLTKPVDPTKGYAFGGAANEMRLINNSVHMPKAGDPDFVGPTMSDSSYDPNKTHVFDRLNMFGNRNIHWTPDLGHAASRGYRIDKTGRTMRSTGGRIPDADKLFKQAKKYVDNHTKHLLNVPDDDIVKALRVAQKKV